MTLNENIIRKIVEASLINVLNERKLLRLSNGGQQSNAQPSTQPMGGDPMMGNAPSANDPAMGGAPMDDAPMGGDPMGGDPMGGDPMSGDPMGGAPMDGGDPSMGGDPMGDAPMDGEDPMGGESGDGDDSTVSIINKLSDTDREAVRAYAESMLNRDEQQNGEDEVPPMDPTMGQDNSGAPMMETVIFTKRQLMKINENFGPTADELNKDKKPLEKKNSKQVTPKSPFSAPKFK